MYYIKCGTDYICKGSYIVNGEKYKVVGTIEEARAFKTYFGRTNSIGCTGGC